MRDALALFGLLTLLYLGACWVARVHPAAGGPVVALCLERVAALLRGGY